MAEAPAPPSDRVARFATALRGEQEGRAGTECDPHRDPGGEDGNGLSIAAKPRALTALRLGVSDEPSGSVSEARLVRDAGPA